ncbi:MAG: RsmB/NOP family class I SAM-dependent RNA methyltransferase [Candidatus Kaelpia aquatica]|nr:RsmB/NOP family class I SAM-dependent RNA methyltransferase [Candidatus Kaelpia aquatica]
MSYSEELEKLPPKFVEKLSRLFAPSLFQRVARTFNIKRPHTFRVNTIKIDRLTLMSELKKKNIKVKNVSWYKDAFILLKPELNKFAKTDLYFNGKVYVQNLSSMLPPLILKPSSSDYVLDLTAAPGSKTTQMAAMMGNRGRILAFDKDPVRFEKLAANLRFQGVVNTELENEDAIGIWRDHFEEFDKILLDAPCSAEGRFNVSKAKTYRYWNQMRVKRMAKKQKSLIRTAFEALKPGGLLLYSTCTFSPEENESVVNYLIRKYPACCKIEPVNLGIKNILPALGSWNGVDFAKGIKNCIRVIPGELMEGFFIALLRKIKSPNECSN